MRSIGRALLLVGLAASPAAAQPTTPAGSTSATPSGSTSATPGDDAPRAATPAPRDNSLAGHVQIAGSAALFVPTGHLDKGAHQRDAMGLGPGFGLDLGFGVAGNLMVGAWGQYASLGAGNRCTDCTTSTVAAGLFAGYHLSALGPFDPWASAGLGYRVTSIGTAVVEPTTTYSGFEWLRLQLGADWYALDKLGFGGFVEIDGGTYSRKSQGQLTDSAFKNSAPHWALLAGLHIAFDSFGR